jgi:hypothetical protein
MKLRFQLEFLDHLNDCCFLKKCAQWNWAYSFASFVTIYNVRMRRHSPGCRNYVAELIESNVTNFGSFQRIEMKRP